MKNKKNNRRAITTTSDENENTNLNVNNTTNEGVTMKRTSNQYQTEENEDEHMGLYETGGEFARVGEENKKGKRDGDTLPIRQINPNNGTKTNGLNEKAQNKNMDTNPPQNYIQNLSLNKPQGINVNISNKSYISDSYKRATKPAVSLTQQSMTSNVDSITNSFTNENLFNSDRKQENETNNFNNNLTNPNNNQYEGFRPSSVLLNDNRTRMSNTLNNIDPNYKTGPTNDIFNDVDSDELFNIINDNLSMFEEPDIVSKKERTPSGSKARIVKESLRQKPSESITKNVGTAGDAEVGDRDAEVSDTKRNLNSDNSFVTPAKLNNPSNSEEIRSDIVVKKLLELKERAQLDTLLQRYNLKLTFDNQEEKPNNNVQCIICYDTKDK